MCVRADRHGWDVPANNVARMACRPPLKVEYTASRPVVGWVRRTEEKLVNQLLFFGLLETYQVYIDVCQNQTFPTGGLPSSWGVCSSVPLSLEIINGQKPMENNSEIENVQPDAR